jgi:hypothetical protein
VDKLENDMNDRELIEAAAKAAGITVLPPSRWTVGQEQFGLWIQVGEHRTAVVWWNPLTDNGDALRLAVRLNIPVYPYDDETSTGTVGVVAKNWGSKEANTRRAIVRAAAAMAA